MYKHIAVAVVGMTIVVGCAARTPVAPDIDPSASQPVQKAQSIYDERYRLWGEWAWYIPASHDRVDVVPRRESRVHVNVLKWLEEDCADCLMITNIRNNGDSTIDLTVRIKHPKPGRPDLTGFDVKGIVMFNGSYEMPGLEIFPPYPDPFRVSWREVGDPELLNPDGYTVRWSPWYESGSSLPLLNYWPGKYSSGTPTANLNAYLNFYVTENRHMFTHTGVVTRVYHIYLPPGPVVAGYAVEACWAPPTKTPVTDPLDDFPISANQDEPYYFRLVVNNDEPLTLGRYCCNSSHDCIELRVDALQWGGRTINGMKTYKPEPFAHGQSHALWQKCEGSLYPDSLQCDGIGFTWPPGPPDYTDGYPEGNYRGWAIAYHGAPSQPDKQIVYTVFNFTTVDRD